MRFAFGEDQLAFRSQLRAFTAKECTAAHVRDAWTSVFGWSPRRWSALAEMGVVGLTVPDAYGGLGLGLVELVLLLEEAGRACLPEPLVETTALGVPLIGGLPGARAEELRLEWLPRVAGGEGVLAVGAAQMPGVPGAEGAHLLLLEHRADGRPELHAIPADQVRQRPMPSLDGARRLAAVEWEPSPDTLIAAGEIAAGALGSLHARAAASYAAVLVGLAWRMIEMAVDHARQRTQFGRAIGTFQAVTHQLADARVRLEFARPVVYRAAWSLDSGAADAPLHASMAKAQASDAAVRAAGVALQVHGAVGYTWEHDLHLWMKRAWALAAAWGDASAHRARVLETLVGRHR